MVYWERHWNRSQRPRFLLWFCGLTLKKAVISPNLRFFLESENLVPSMAVGVFERFTQTRDVCVFIVCLLTLSDSWYPARLYHSPLLPGSVSGLTLVKCSIILPLHVATGVSVYKAHGQWHLGFPEVSPLGKPSIQHFQEHWKPCTTALYSPPPPHCHFRSPFTHAIPAKMVCLLVMLAPSEVCHTQAHS